MGQIIGFGIRRSRPARLDWSTQEIAEFYRVESALIQAGLSVETDRGLSDEGDPWLVFCHSDSGDVIAHFARMDGEYVVAAAALPHALRGPDLTQIVRRFVSENPISLPSIEMSGRDNVILHPAVLLTAFVATVLLLEFPAKGLASESMVGEGETQADGDLVAEHHSGQIEFRGTPKQDDDRGSSEKAFLIAAITVAAGMADLSFQANHSPFMDPALEHDVLGETHEVAGQEESHTSQIDLIDLSGMDFFADNAAQESESAPVQKHISENTHTNTMEVIPTHEAAAEHLPGEGKIDIPLPQAETETYHSSTDEARVIELTKPASLSPVVQTETEPSSASGHSMPEKPGGTAVAWLEKEAAAAGWSVVILNEDTHDAQRAAEIVDQGNLAHSGGGDPAPSGITHASQHDQTTAEVIQAFLASDNDIAAVERHDGSVVMFDRSDVENGQLLDMHSWSFDNHTTVTILGNADTVSHVVALVA